MVSRNQDCIDCNIKFTSLRCFSCQNFHNKNNLSTCPDCENLYSSTSKDGKSFQKCYDCYQNGFSNCKKCNKRCFKEYSISTSVLAGFLCRYFNDKSEKQKMQVEIKDGIESTTEITIC